jgi:hypothetical protein
MARLGLAYRYGTGVPRNLGKAVAWLKRGVEADDGSAMLLLGDMTLFGLGTPRSYDEALVLYRKADARNYRWREPVLSMLAGCSEEFCRLLWTAVVARYSNFEPLRGGEEPKGWSATIALPGAEACLISKEKASRYRCFYGRKVTPGKADRIFRDLVARVRATLPAGWRTQMKTDHPREKWAMSFLAGPPGPTPAIAVDQVDDAGAERPGLRTVQLTVLNAGAK